MKRFFVAVLTLGLFAGFAEAQEVLSPWGDSPQSVRQASVVRGDVIALRALGTRIPPWALNEVLDPFDRNTGTSEGLRPQERALSIAARARAPRLGACFPAQHSHQRHWTDLRAPSSSNAGGQISRCLRQAMNDLLPSTGTFVLALRFDDQGLRDVYVMKRDRP